MSILFLSNLNLIFIGINAFEWVKNLSFKPKIFQYSNDSDQLTVGVSLSNYIFLTDCILCGKKRSSCKLKDTNSNKLCDKCKNLDQFSLTKLRFNFQKSEKKLMNLLRVCQMCTGNSNSNMVTRNECISMDCPNNFLLLDAKQDVQKTDYIRHVIDDYF